MDALLKRMLVGVPVTFNEQIGTLGVDPSNPSRLVAKGSEGRELDGFDAVVVAVPAQQAALLLADIAPELAARAQTAVMRGTWAVMLDYDGPGPEVDFDAAELRSRPLRWVAREASKPGRLPGARWVLHGAAVDATDDRRSHPAGRQAPSTADIAARAVELLLADFTALVGPTAEGPSFSQAHLWRAAFVEQAIGTDCLVSHSGRVIACGDWCVGPRIEAAFLSGTAAAGRLLALR